MTPKDASRNLTQCFQVANVALHCPSFFLVKALVNLFHLSLLAFKEASFSF